MNRSNPPHVEWTIAGVDFLQLDPAARPEGKPLTDWLTDALRQAMDEGRLSANSLLPATRALAEELQISRGVVTESYRRLTDEGRLTADGRRGTKVRASATISSSPHPTATTSPSATSPAAALSGPTAGPPHSFGSSPSNALLEELRSAPAMIDLSAGRPDLSTFPRAAWLAAERRVLAKLPHSALGYPDAAGMVELRTAVCDWLARYRGVVAQPEELIIVSGVAQSLTLLAHLLGRQNPVGAPVVATEDPGSLGARESLQAWGCRTTPVGVDDQGLLVEQLQGAGRRGAGDPGTPVPAGRPDVGRPTSRIDRLRPRHRELDHRGRLRCRASL